MLMGAITGVWGDGLECLILIVFLVFWAFVVVFFLGRLELEWIGLHVSDSTWKFS